MTDTSSSFFSSDQNRLKAIFNTVVDGIITIDNQGTVESLNPAAAELFGYEPEEVIGKNVNFLMPEPYHAEHDKYIDNHLKTGKKKIIGIGREVKGKRKDGSTFPFWLKVEKVQLEDRIIFTGIIHDVSDLRQVEQDLSAAEKRMNAIINTAVDGIIIIDKKAIMEVVNPAAADMFGYNAKELVGKNVKILMSSPHRKQHDNYIGNYHRTGERKIIGIGREVKGLRKDGSQFPFNLSISEVHLPEKTVYVGVIHDISEQKANQQRIEELNTRLEQMVEERTEKLAEAVNKLLKTNKQLENQIQATEEARAKLKVALAKEQELNQLKSRFVSTASHEFRTPLATIKSSASLIARYTAVGTEEKREKHVNRIKSAVNNLNDILDDFLSISKLEEGKVPYEPSQFDILEMTHETIGEIKSILQTGQNIRYQHNGETQVCLDKKFYKNIIINLLSNASKYSSQYQNIDLMVQCVNDRVLIEIQDYGIGIPQSEQQHLFERFFRAQNAINIKGTGLGLNIVKKYIDIMGGSISFTSQENEGTIFKVELPSLS